MTSRTFFDTNQLDAGYAAPVPVVFYATASGTEPVRVWLKDLNRNDRRTIGSDILAVQKGWPIGLPLCRPIGRGLWEVRSSLQDGTIARVIIAFHEGDIVLLNGFIKKSRKTPLDEIELARKRLSEMKS